MGAHHKKASDAALRAFHEKVAALGAVTLPDAAAAVGIDEDSLRKWDRQLGSTSVFVRGPRNARVCRLEELKAELERWRCTWPEQEGGCDRFALLSTSGRCKRHDAAVPRHGKVFSTEYANARRISHPDLITRLETGEIPGKRVERSGRPVAYLLDERKADAVLDEHWRCRWHKGCDRYGIGPTRHCNDHAGAATAIANAQGMVTVICANPTCGAKREDYPSQLRAGRRGRTDRDPDRPRLCHSRNLASEEFDRKRRKAVADTWAARGAVIAAREGDGLVPRPAIAAEYGLVSTPSLTRSLAERGVRHQRVVVLGTPFVLFDRSHAIDHRRERLRVDPRARAALETDRQISRVRKSLEKRGVTVTADWVDGQHELLRHRRTWLLRISPGTPAGRRAATAERIRRWMETAHDVADWPEPPESPPAILLAVALEDWQSHAEDWPRERYPPDPSDPGGLDPRWYTTAVDRLRKQIPPVDVKALLSGRK